MKKTLCSILLIVSLFCLASLSGNKRIYAEENPNRGEEQASIEAEERMMRQRHAVTADDRIISSFEVNKHGIRVYPDEYSGAYVDGDYLQLCLKNPDEATIHRYLEIAGEEAPYIRIQSVSYSLNELQMIADQLASSFREKGYILREYGVDIPNNGLEFVVAEEYVDIIRSIIKQQFPEIHSSVVPGDPIVYTSVFLKGGDKIVNSTLSTPPFTLGACGTRYGSYVVITAGHASTANYQTIKLYGNAYSTYFASIIQRSAALNPGETAYGDYAVAIVTNSDYFTTAMIRTNLTGGFQAIESGATASMYATVTRFGQVTGSGTGQVTGLNKTVYIGDEENDIKLTGMTKITNITNGAMDGDSGGPYTLYNAYNEYCFCGIQSCGLMNGAGVCTVMYMTPYSLIHDETGFNVEIGE